jgi:two-component system, OmpR family, sensor histidine kinase TctE
MSFSARLLEWMLAPLLFLWLISLGITFLAARESVDTALDDQLNLAANALQQEWHEHRSALAGYELASSTSARTFPSSTLRRILSSDEAFPIRYLIVDRDDRALSGDEELIALVRETADERFAYAVAASREVKGANTVLDEAFVRVVRYRVDVGDRAMRMVVSQARERQTPLLRSILFYIAIPQSVVLITAVYLAWYGLAYVARPMMALKQHLDRRGGENLQALPVRLAPEEIEPLVQSINSLMARLSASLAAQRRFIANAAHQLRTPLAALRAHGELLRKTEDPVRQSQTIDQLLTTSSRANRLANQLLSLARAETAGTTGHASEVELNALCQNVAQEVLPLALERNIDFAFEPADTKAAVNGDATLLSELVHNLVDNALKYTPRSGSVHIAVRVAPMRIQVDDSGPGISETERDRVFAPFMRIARFDGETKHLVGGTGLGLAIVEEVARAHAAHVRIDTSDLGGARFTVTFADAIASKPMPANDEPPSGVIWPMGL